VCRTVHLTQTVTVLLDLDRKIWRVRSDPALRQALQLA